jgi:hypothetical protein
MYDTITTHLRCGVSSNTQERLASLLSTPVRKEKEGIFSISGKLHNLKVNISPAGIYATGSAPKFLYDENFNNYPWNTAALYIEALSDITGCDFKESNISEVHIGASFSTTTNPGALFSLLGHHPTFPKNIVKNTTYFGRRNSACVLAYYDKGKEAKLPLVNLGRYEMRLKNYRLKNLGISSCQDLNNTHTQTELLAMWKDQHNQISKLLCNIDLSTITTSSDAVNAFLKQNECAYLEFIQSAKASGGLLEHNYRRAKQKIIKDAERFQSSDNDELHRIINNYEVENYPNRCAA